MGTRVRVGNDAEEEEDNARDEIIIGKVEEENEEVKYRLKRREMILKENDA